MNDTVQTWHYGLVARHSAEKNTTMPEIDYYQAIVHFARK